MEQKFVVHICKQRLKFTKHQFHFERPGACKLRKSHGGARDLISTADWIFRLSIVNKLRTYVQGHDIMATHSQNAVATKSGREKDF